MPSQGNDDDSEISDRLLRPSRRDMLATLGMTGLAALAGCTGDTGETTTTAPATEPDDSGTPTEDSTTEEPLPEVKGTWTDASSTDAQSLNWLQIADTTSGGYIDLALDAAWAIDDNQEIFPLWAEPSTDDAQTYEITLRDNLQWGGDYGQMTADDWVYMIKNVFQAEGNWAGYPSADDWFGTNPETGESEPLPVEKTGDLSFTIELFDVDPAWPFKPVMWGQYCMPKGLLEKYVSSQDAEGLKKDEEVQTLAYAGNLGPYTYDSWSRDSQYVVTRNENYYMREVEDLPEAWSNAPYFEEYVIKVIKEESARLGALESSGITSSLIPPDKANGFEENPDIQVKVQDQPFVSVLAYNMRANGWKPFRKKAVRQALAHAVNKEALATGVYRGYAKIAQTMQPEWSPWYDDSKVTNYGVGENYGPDITRSKLESALSDTEYSYDGDKLVDGNGDQVTLSLFFDAGQSDEKTTAEFIAQEYGKNAGINVEVKSTTSFIDKFAQNAPPEGEEPEWTAGSFNAGPREVSVSSEAWDMSVNLGFNTYPYTPSASKTFFREKGTINYYGYAPERDIAAVYDEASATADEEERKELFGEAFGYINEEQPFGFLVMESDIVGYQDEVVGPTNDFASGWDYQTWHFK